MSAYRKQMGLDIDPEVERACRVRPRAGCRLPCWIVSPPSHVCCGACVTGVHLTYSRHDSVRLPCNVLDMPLDGGSGQALLSTLSEGIFQEPCEGIGNII